MNCLGTRWRGFNLHGMYKNIMETTRDTRNRISRPLKLEFNFVSGFLWIILTYIKSEQNWLGLDEN